ncbi:pyocin knob domain-containing protein [Geobacillus stearothermophilus]|uniref:pyocin knob domain-containing protein n=1 Tax=Geobacillus stearothermophilus TaxID=1422 RepID=UPI002E23ADE7|nr:pyocin knob domain-containing protein [Geobacillus stearothermophilus]
MAEISKFFNSAPGDPRTYQASDFADYFGSVLSTGLLHTDNIPALEVKCDGNDLRTYVTPGKAIIQGYLYENTSNLYLEHALPEPTLDRIDRIVLRLDKRNQSRYIRLFVKQGTPAENPVPPELQRDDFIYELSLAQIRVRANTSTLNPADLIDERLDENLCGLVHSLISIPTSQFQQQWDEFMAGIQDEGFASAEEFNAHLADTVKHITAAERTAWNSIRQKHQVTADDGSAINISGQDLNNIKMTGIYMGDNLTNAPIPKAAGNWCYIEVIRHNDTYIIQKAYKLNSGQNSLYMRRCEAGTWSAWSEDLFTSVSDGKAQLESTITAKGGTVTKAGAVPTFAELNSGINSIPTGKKWASGTVYVTTGNVSIRGLAFRPSVIFMSTSQNGNLHAWTNAIPFRDMLGVVDASYGSPNAYWITPTIYNDGFSVSMTNGSHYWIAIE